jgi:hypothetical protein
MGGGMLPPMFHRLKRTLRPIRPVLLPLWRPVRPIIEGEIGPRAAVEEAIARRRLEARFARAPDGAPRPIRPLRKREFDELAARETYYRARWDYMSVAGRAAGELILRHDLRTALELGPYLRPLVVGADVLDLRHHEDLECEGSLIVHDARRTPWPIKDKAYGLFVGLQVFEHLGSDQPAAFREVRRIARDAIISLPIDWQMNDPHNVHHQLSHERALSWFAPVVPNRVEVGTPGRKKRLVYIFEDLPAPKPEEEAT